MLFLVVLVTCGGILIAIARKPADLNNDGLNFNVTNEFEGSNALNVEKYLMFVLTCFCTPGTSVEATTATTPLTITNVLVELVPDS